MLVAMLPVVNVDLVRSGAIDDIPAAEQGLTPAIVRQRLAALGERMREGVSPKKVFFELARLGLPMVPIMPVSPFYVTPF